MAILMINCPSTGRAVSTGIEMSGVEQLPNVIARIECRACGCVHEWTKEDAWLAEGGEQYRDLVVDKSVAKMMHGPADRGDLNLQQEQFALLPERRERRDFI